MALNARSHSIREPIAVSAKQNGFFPKTFVWRGRRHDVRVVESCQTEMRRDWQGKVQRHRFRVRTANALFELIQDVRRDTWQLERVWGD